MGFVTLYPKSINPRLKDLGDVLCRGCRVEISVLDEEIKAAYLLDKASQDKLMKYLYPGLSIVFD